MSYILQKKIANTFREQIMKKGFNHVSVSSLMRILGYLSTGMVD